MGSVMSNQSKFAVGDNQQTLTATVQMPQSQQAYGELAQKSLLELSIKTGQSIEELLSQNSQLQSLIQDDKKLIKQVWTQDDVSPASFLFNYKDSNIKYEWNQNCMSRLIDGKNGTIEVQVHQDDTIFHVKDFGNFIRHQESNLKDVVALRNFTCDTVPFIVHTNQKSQGGDIEPTSQPVRVSYNP